MLETPALPVWLGPGVGNVFFEMECGLVVITPDAARQFLTSVAAGVRNVRVALDVFVTVENPAHDDIGGPRITYPWGAPMWHATAFDADETIPLPFPAVVNPDRYELEEQTYFPQCGCVGFWFPDDTCLHYVSREPGALLLRHDGTCVIGTTETVADYSNENLRYIEYGCFLRGPSPEPTLQPVRLANA